MRHRGEIRSATFATKRRAAAWEAMTEAEAAKANGRLLARPLGTLAALIDRYVAELYPLRP